MNVLSAGKGKFPLCSRWVSKQSLYKDLHWADNNQDFKIIMETWFFGVTPPPTIIETLAFWTVELLTSPIRVNPHLTCPNPQCRQSFEGNYYISDIIQEFIGRTPFTCPICYSQIQLNVHVTSDGNLEIMVGSPGVED